MADENKIILEFPAQTIDMVVGETITFDNISGYLDSVRVTYNGELLSNELASLETDKANVSDVYTKTETDSLLADKADSSTLSEAVDLLAHDISLKADISSLATVATSGDYNDLINKPIIPEQAQSDWNEVDSTQPDYIKNKPTLSAVATSGDYADLSNKPSIPTNTSDLVNDSGFTSIDDSVTALDKTWSSDKINTAISGLTPYVEVSGTLLSGNTSITLSDASITTTSTIDIYTGVFGIQPISAVVTSGSVTLTFLTQTFDLSVKVRVS